MKPITTPPLDTGTVDEVKKSKALRQCHLRQVDPLSKPLISGSVDGFQKLNSHQDFRQSIHCPKPIKLSVDGVRHSIYPQLGAVLPTPSAKCRFRIVKMCVFLEEFDPLRQFYWLAEGGGRSAFNALHPNVFGLPPKA